MESILNETKQKMDEVLVNLSERFSNIRAGRANPAMVDTVMVNYYGTPTPITNIANITIPEARKLFIKPFDKNSLKDIERAINEANLGLAPVNNGEVIILTMPELTEERRRDYVKQAGQMTEDAKIEIRKAREDARNLVKKADLSEDETKKHYDDIQEITQEFNSNIEKSFKDKEKELMTV